MILSIQEVSKILYSAMCQRLEDELLIQSGMLEKHGQHARKMVVS